MTEEIRVDEWLQEMERLQQASGNDDGLTGPELMEMLGMGSTRFHRLLKAGVKAGKIVVGKREVTHDWDGRHRTYTVYRILKGKKK